MVTSITKQARGVFIAIALVSACVLCAGTAFADDAQATSNQDASTQGLTTSQEGSTQNLSVSDPVLDKATAYTFSSIAKPAQVIHVPKGTQKVGARLRTSAANDSMVQKFVAILQQDGTYAIRSIATGRYIATSGAKVVQAKKGTAAAAHWKVYAQGSGFVFENVKTGKVLTIGKVGSSGAALTCSKWEGKKTQLFQPNKVDPITEGYYTFLSSANTSLAVSVKDGARKNAANIRLFKRNGTSAQKFLVTSLGKGWYRITNASNGRALSVANGSSKAGANVRQYARNGTKAQKWKIVLTKDGTFKFVNAISKKVLGAAKAKPKHKTNLRVYKSNDTAAQRFLLVPVSMSGEYIDLNVPCYMQNPELPTGCESVAMTNALRYYGFSLGKTTIAYQYLPWSGTDFVYSFMGDPRTSSGAAVMAPGLTNAANRYLKAKGSKLRAKNITGTSFKNLYSYLKQGTPVVVWSTIGFGYVGPATAWAHGYTMHQNTHTVVLSGYNPKTKQVRVSDSISGQVWRPASRFEQIYNAMGKQAIIIK